MIQFEIYHQFLACHRNCTRLVREALDNREVSVRLLRVCLTEEDKNRHFEVACSVFDDLKEKERFLSPTATGDWCTRSLLKEKKSECSGNTQLLREPRYPNYVILVERLYGPYF